MNEQPRCKSIVVAKFAALAGFLALIVCSYYLRSEVLALSHIKFSADEVRAANELQRLRESFPDQQQQYAAALQQYELQRAHYDKMLELYQNNYDEYVQRIEDKYDPPPQPVPPVKPDPPELAEQLHEINHEFRTRKNHYFETSSRLNWLACAAAMSLVGGLLYLMLFDTQSPRWHYLVAMVISFVFLIGPAMQAILSGIIGFLQEPPMY